MPNLHVKAPHAGVSATKLLWDHTVFPYSTAFLPREMVARLESRLLQRPMPAPWGAVPLAQSVTQGLSHRRYCVVCAKIDTALLGESYWHRVHNLPGVYRCAQHGVPLRETQLVVRDGMRLQTLAMPNDVSGYVKHFAVPLGVLTDVARRSADALTRPLRNEEASMGRYREELTRLGLMHGSLTASHDFAYRLLKLYGHANLGLCGADFYLKERSPWPALVTRSQSGAALAPIKHLLVQSFFALASPPTVGRQWGRPGPKARDRTALDASLWRQLCADLGDPTSVAGLVPSRTWLTQLGSWGTYSHLRGELPQSAALVDSLRRDQKANALRHSGKRKPPARRA